jgi:hypothetical protein
MQQPFTANTVNLGSWLQGSFFRRQNTEGLTLLGLFMEGTTLTCLETYSDAKKRTLVGCTVLYYNTVVRWMVGAKERPLTLHD